MSNKNLSSVTKEATVLKDSLEVISDAIDGINPADLVRTEEDALAVLQEILEGIPVPMRGLYPEDDILAALAFAPIYYKMIY